MSREQHAILIALLMLTFTASADDIDRRTFPGASCQTSTNEEQIMRDSRGRMFNTSPAKKPQVWICPIARDAFTANSIESAVITVVDRNRADGDPNVSCTFHSNSRSGSPCGDKSDGPKHTDGAEVKTLFFAEGAADFKTCANGYYYIQCSIPGTYNSLQSGVISYEVREHAP
jgi:hypothetical protein